VLTTSQQRRAPQVEILEAVVLVDDKLAVAVVQS